MFVILSTHNQFGKVMIVVDVAVCSKMTWKFYLQYKLSVWLYRDF